MALGDVIGGAVYNLRIIAAEGVEARLATGAFPGDFDATQVMVENLRKAVDEKFGDGGQAENRQDPGADFQADCGTRCARRKRADPKETEADPGTYRAPDERTAGNDHGHLANHVYQVVDDAGDVDVCETPPKPAGRLLFGADECGSDIADTAKVEL
ncbi:hypothetical protein A242_07108 [Pseudomonas syringae pv. actinidiae ICMP 19095]|nr:hypothetical protein A248_07107 [Pseudomonas syringae pv. actinidiae ICMP 19100]EPN36091.1 hypothetical protein A243_07218 [Pseudomonas syringae pv. actinidiae ICMP 18883]EPN44554.1 hypothetical protein A242_07108 [Pseudomonas syringae pv. actinidiae ICMP 19095]